MLASVVGVDRRGRKQGAIVEVLERRSPRLVGRVVEQNGLVLVTPDDRRLHQDILIPPGKERGARSGQIVVVEITDQPTAYRGPMGRVLAVLGERLTPSLVVEMAIASHNLPNEWPAATLRDAAEVEPEVSPAEIADRVDLRDLPLVTIDGADARDFDDAVYAEPNADGFRLVVAIADVSHYVRPGSALDSEAYERATSVYFPGFVVPMLPETLSNGICSLNPKVERLCMVCDMQVDREGEVTRSKFYAAVMRSHCAAHVRARLAGDRREGTRCVRGARGRAAAAEASASALQGACESAAAARRDRFRIERGRVPARAFGRSRATRARTSATKRTSSSRNA